MLRPLLVVFAALVATNTTAAEPSLYASAIRLIDDRGRSTTLAAWRGKPAIVTMEYSDCRFICSITLQRMKDVQAAADAVGRRFEFIILSLDPRNDTPEAWTRYRRSRELDRDNWSFLTASAADTPALARALGVTYWVYDGHIMHDLRLLYLDAEGRIVKVMDTYDASAGAFVH